MSLENILFILVDYLDFESMNNLDEVMKFNKIYWTMFLFRNSNFYNERNPKEKSKRVLQNDGEC